jgi:putative addiction module component (TIGR02574 family)
MADTATMEALLSLPVDERAEIAELLLESLNPPAEGLHRDLWIKEIEARYAAWERGEIASTDALEVSERLRKEYS